MRGDAVRALSAAAAAGLLLAVGGCGGDAPAARASSPVQQMTRFVADGLGGREGPRRVVACDPATLAEARRAGADLDEEHEQPAPRMRFVCSVRSGPAGSSTELPARLERDGGMSYRVRGADGTFAETVTEVPRDDGHVRPLTPTLSRGG